jgi:hypothetical protein
MFITFLIDPSASRSSDACLRTRKADRRLWKACALDPPALTHSIRAKELRNNAPRVSIHVSHLALKTMVLENTLEHRADQIQMAELQLDGKSERRRRFICRASSLHDLSALVVKHPRSPNELSEIDLQQYRVFVHFFCLELAYDVAANEVRIICSSGVPTSNGEFKIIWRTQVNWNPETANDGPLCCAM